MNIQKRVDRPVEDYHCAQAGAPVASRRTVTATSHCHGITLTGKTFALTPRCSKDIPSLHCFSHLIIEGLVCPFADTNYSMVFKSDVTRVKFFP